MRQRPIQPTCRRECAPADRRRPSDRGNGRAGAATALEAAGGAAAGPAPAGSRQLPTHDRLPRQPDRSRRHADADQDRDALGYHDHYVVDGGKRRIILAALVTPADVMENVPLRDLLWRVCFRRKSAPHQVTGDTTYGTVENIVAVEDAGIRAFFPLPDFEHRTPFFGQAQFTYDADAGRVPLPAGTAAATPQDQVHRGKRSSTGPTPATCNACPVKSRCTDQDHGRIVHRSFYADYLDKVRGYHATEAYQKAMRKRQVWVEPLFAEAKEWHGSRRLRLRGLLNANIQGLLVAAGQNLKRFLAGTGWGRRHAPCGSLMAQPRGLAQPLPAWH